MGCDIHAHIEIRFNGKWEHYAIPRIERWYELFGIMACVRGDGPAIVEPKGLPNDISVVTRMDYERMSEDAHTPSWFNEHEIDGLEKWLQHDNFQSTRRFVSLEHDLLKTYLFGNGITDHLRYEDCVLPDGCDAVRLVFWFDN